MKRTDYVWIVLAGIAWLVVFLLAERTINGSLFSGFPLDDSWIHAQFAHNLAQGNGFSYTGAEQTPGDTSPLWVLIIAAVFSMFGEFHAILEIRLLSGMAYLLTGLVTAVAVYKTTGKRPLGLLAGIIVMSLSDMIWEGSAGMETAFFSFMTMAALWSYHCDRNRISVRTGMLFGLAALTRPEASLLFILILVDTVIGTHSTKRGSSWILKKFQSVLAQWRAVTVFAMFALLNVAYCWFTARQLFPNTYYSKGGGLHVIAPFYLYASYFYAVFVSANPFLFLLACVGVIVIVRNPERYPKKYFVYFLLLFPVIGTFASATVLTRRYFFSFLPVFLPPAMIGLDAIVGMIEGSVRQRRAFLGIGAATVLFSCFMNLIGIYPLHAFHGKVYSEADFFAWNVRNINDQQVAVAKWVSASLPPDALVAVNDVGAIGYLSRHRVLDVCGLVSNDVTKIFKKYPQFDNAKPHILDFLKFVAKPDYVIIYNAWFPAWRLQLPVIDSFEVIAPNNITCGSDTMTVMHMDWQRAATLGGKAVTAVDSVSMKRF